MLKHESNLNPRPLRRVNLRGLPTQWVQSGKKTKPIFLFLHGFPDSPHIWREQISYFSRDYQVICPYLRGVGDTTEGVQVRRYGMRTSTLEWLQVLKKIDPESKRPVVVCGHDLGGVHAWHLASFLGKRLRALIWINSVSLSQMLSRWNRPEQHRKSWYIYAMQVPWLADLIGKYSWSSVQKLAHRIGKAPQKMTEWPLETNAYRSINQYRALVRESWYVRHRCPKRLKAPLLVLWGENEPFLLMPDMGELEKVSENPTLRVLPGGHWLQSESSQSLNESIERFLSQYQYSEELPC